MTQLNPHLVVHTRPLASERNVLKGKGYRISVLTPYLLRVEVQKNNIFTDEATQYIWNRDFPPVEFSYVSTSGNILIKTEDRCYNFEIASKKITYVYFADKDKWVRCDNRANLKGTRRTLDMKCGRVRLGNGVISKKGVAVLKDDGMILKDGEPKQRKADEKDSYIFAYGNSYRAAINDYFYMTGETPLLPRYALGNWWSRFHAYTQDEYLSLMDRFKKENIPFTVATVDMDWHWVKVNEKFNLNYKCKNPLQGEGWTGYSWNTDLFPDYKEFLRKLHEENYRVTLNLHPADGIRKFEDVYPRMAEAMGIDPKSGQTVKFDISDNKFINNYFDIVHHPYEDDGVDFWWMDWQQGKKSSLKGMDPLWILNHYHYLDNCRDGRRGLILSRFCGIGSHRYPIGFSGDYRIKWKSLKFQPEFTNRASNIGYDWWSHDIGGHMLGYSDDEMYLRWCQYGVFSPINRLHSTNFDLQGKEPWKRSETVRRIAGDYLRLRHALIPYIYTADYLTHTENIPLCEPMYFSYPNEKDAYKVPNQYKFGSELIVCPVTEKVNKKIKMAKTEVWLPEGRYTDMFTGYIYEGGRKVTMYRDIEYIPVLAKAGAIIPMSADEGNSCSNPQSLRLFVYRGNNSYSMYEDDGISMGYKSGKFVTTEFKVSENGDTVKFNICPVIGDESLIPENRKYIICFKDITDGNVIINGESYPFDKEIELNVESAVGAEIIVENARFADNGDAKENVNIVFSRYDGGNLGRMLKYYFIGKADGKEALRKAIKRSLFPKDVKRAALEKLL